MRALRSLDPLSSKGLRVVFHRNNFKAALAAALAVFIAGYSGGDADAAPLPSVRITTAPLVSPTSASTYYGGSATHTYNATFGYGALSANPRPPEVVELARALKGDPDLIYEYVRNTIKVNFEYGLQKGALGAIIDHSGTAFDQAQLLVELLRQSGYTANYKQGTVTLTQQQFTDWTGLSDAKAACQFLASGGIPAAINGSSDASCNYTGNVTSVTMAHIWAEVAIGGSYYLFDPSYKAHTLKSGINLASAMGYSAGTAFTQATTGFTQGTETRGANSARWFKTLGGMDLTTWSQSLLTYIKTNLPAGELEDVIGGGIIDPVTIPAGGFRQASLPYTATPSTTWTADIPDQYRTTLRVHATDPSAANAVAFNGATNLFYVDEIYGRRMRIDTNFDQPTAVQANSPLYQTNGFRISLTIDGVEQAYYTTTILQVSTRFLRNLDVTLVANHPYAAAAESGQPPGSWNSGTGTCDPVGTNPDGSYGDRCIVKNVYVITPVTIIHGWGDTGPGLPGKWSSELADDKAEPKQREGKLCAASDQGYTDTNCTGQLPPSAGDFANDKLASSWLAQFSRMMDLQARIGASRVQHHSSLGFVYADAWSSVVNGTQSSNCGTTCIWGVQDAYTVIDVDSALSVTHSTADSIGRRAVVYSIAASGAALEGSVVQQILDLPLVSSTATRFFRTNNPPYEWNAPNLKSYYFDPNNTPYALPSDIAPRRFYLFNPTNTGLVSQVLTYAGLETGYPSNIPSNYPGLYKGALGSELQLYLADGFNVVSSSEAYLGTADVPGQLIVYNAANGSNFREFPKSRGGAFVAIKTNASGDPVAIAHLVNNLSGQQKGGGAGGAASALASFSAESIASTLKSRFTDKARALGIDLRTGRATYATPSLLTTGTGALPFQLALTFIYAGPGTSEPVLGNPPQNLLQNSFPTAFRGVTHNWDIRLKYDGDGFEAMGATSPQAAATTIAAIFAAQDIYRSGQTSSVTDAFSISQAASPILYSQWQRTVPHNVVTVIQGGSPRRFLLLADGTWQPPKGEFARLTTVGNAFITAPACSESGNFNGNDWSVVPTYGWGYVQGDDPVYTVFTPMVFTLTNANGDAMTFKRWVKTQDCRRYAGWTIDSWTFPHSNVPLQFDYADAGRLTQVTIGNGVGRHISFAQSSFTVPAGGAPDGAIVGPYGTPKQLSGSFQDENSRQVSYTTSGANTITNLDGGVIKLVYDPPVARSATTRPIPYPRLHQVFEPVNQSVAAMEYDYDSIGNIKEVRDATSLAQGLGVRGSYKFYIGDGTRGQREDPLGGLYSVYYDDQGRAIRHVDEIGRTVTSTYDVLDRLVTRTYPEGDQELFTYDSHSNVTRLTRKAKPGSGLADIMIDATWDQTWNKPLTITAPYSTGDTVRTTTMTYYASGAGAGMVKDVTRPTIGGVSPKYTYTYATSGLLTQETTPIGATQSTKITINHTYDGKGNRTKTVVDDITGQLKLTTQWQYANTGVVTRVMDPRGYLTLTTYDAMLRPTIVYHSSNVVTAIGNAVTGYASAARTTYDLNGRPTLVEAASAITGTTISGWTTRATTTYTATGKVSSVADGAGNLTATSYDALDRPDIVTDPINRKVRTTYDAAGQTYQVIRAYGSALQQNYATYAYTLNGQVLSVTDARGRVTKNKYDGFDRLVKLLFPDATPANDNDNPNEQYAYDPGGRRTSMVNRAGQTLTYGYDNLDELISRTQSSLPTRTYTYDLGGRRTQAKDMNGATVVAQTDFTYDTAGRETRERRNDWSQNVDFVYDANSNVTGLKWPDAFTATYTFDPLNRITQIANGSTVYRTYTYDLFSRRTQQTAYTGTGQVVSSYTYESDDDLSQIVHNYPGATADLTLAYTYSAAHQLTNAFTSESLNRHVVSGSNGTQSYTSANELNQYPSITPIGGSLTTIAYDANGNLTSDGVNTFSYDPENRLLSVSGGASATYAYDALDRRMSKTTGGVTTRYLQAGSDEIAEYNSSGTLLRRFVPGPGTDERAVWIESASTSPPATALNFPHTDRLGSVLSITSNTGAITARYEYNAWGGSNSSTAGYPFRYTGQRLDPETGLMFYKARVYSMALGRFLQTDPIGTKDDLNLYAYTSNDPVNRADPAGTEAVSWLIENDPHFQTQSLAPRPANVDDLQTALDGVGLIPGIGEPADGLNAIISAGRGNLTEAGLSMAAMVPFLGWGATGGKLALKHGDEAVEGALRAYKEIGGHHIFAKAAFEGAEGYSKGGALAVSLQTLKEYGVAHADITAAQQRLFRELGSGGSANILAQHARIAYVSLVEAGIPPSVAKEWVAASESQLVNWGVTPTRIPWSGK